jgi:hypothetical protein
MGGAAERAMKEGMLSQPGRSVTVEAQYIPPTPDEDPPVHFLSSAALDKELFPGQCRSDSIRNNYGWNRWKSDLMPLNSVTIARRTTLLITLVGVGGFTLNETETITCGPFSTGLALDDVRVDPQTFSFVIERSETSDVRMWALEPKLTRQVPTGQPYPTQVLEALLRRSGFHAMLSVNNNAWDLSQRAVIAAGFSCGPVVDCAKLLVDSERHLLFDDATPHQLIVSVPPEDLASFDVPFSDAVPHHVLTFLPTREMFLKDAMTATPTTSIAVRIVAARLRAPPRAYLRVMDPTTGEYDAVEDGRCVNMTEDCLRGVQDGRCERAVLLSLSMTQPEETEFIVSVRSRSDIASHMFQTVLPKDDASSAFNRIATTFVKAEGAIRPFARLLEVHLNPLPASVDISRVEELTVTLPRSATSNSELIEYPHPLRVCLVPSPAHIIYTLPESPLRTIVSVGVELAFTIARPGEAFRTHAAVTQFDLADFVTAIPQLPPICAKVLGVLGDCAQLPQTTTGVVAIAVGPCPGHLQLLLSAIGDLPLCEYTLRVPPELTVSGIAPASGPATEGVWRVVNTDVSAPSLGVAQEEL